MYIMKNKVNLQAILGLTLFMILSPLAIRVSFAKTLPRAIKSQSAKVGKPAVSGTLIVSPKLSRDRKILNVYFANLNKVKSVSYTLTYKTNGKDEGIGGSIQNSGIYSTSRQLVFGTESSGVYRYHSNITGARLEVVAILSSGKKLIKRFTIKV